MSGISEISSQGRVIAKLIPSSFRPEGLSFVTPNEFTLQVGIHNREENHKFHPHIHNPKVDYKVTTTSEIIYVEKGKLKITIFDIDWSQVGEVTLTPGDLFIQVAGGHGFQVIEKCTFLEFKQGPHQKDELVRVHKEDLPEGYQI